MANSRRSCSSLSRLRGGEQVLVDPGAVVVEACEKNGCRYGHVAILNGALAQLDSILPYERENADACQHEEPPGAHPVRPVAYAAGAHIARHGHGQCKTKRERPGHLR